MEQTKWMEDPALQNIAREKLVFLQSVVFDSKKLSQKEMMPFLMAMAAKAKKSQITFDKAETQLIVDVMKKYSTKEDLNSMNQILSLTHFL